MKSELETLREEPLESQGREAQYREALKVALPFCPEGVVEPNHTDMYYFTFSYEEDVKLQEKIERGRALLALSDPGADEGLSAIREAQKALGEVVFISMQGGGDYEAIAREALEKLNSRFGSG